MKKINISITLCFLLLSVKITPLYSQSHDERKVVWIHGLNGHGEKDKPSVWNKGNFAKGFASDRKMFPYIVEYNKTKHSGVIDYAKKITENAGKLMDESSILIGHSMGGMAIREIDVNIRKPRGIITAGAPLDGSKMVHQKNSKIFFMTLFSHLVFAYVPIPGLDIFVENISAGFIESKVSKYLSDIAPSGHTYSHLSPGSEYIKNIKDKTTSTPKIHIWGNEHKPVVWNTLEAIPLISKKEIQKMANRLKCRKKNFSSTSFYGHRVIKAYNFLAGDDGETMWTRDVIGSSKFSTKVMYLNTPERIEECKTELRKVNAEICRRRGWLGFFCTWTYKLSTFECQKFSSFAEEPVTIPVYVLLKSDGIVPEDSQRGDGQKYSQNARDVEALGVNHLEMGTHEEMKNILDDIWDGKYSGMKDKPKNTGEESVFFVNERKK